MPIQLSKSELITVTGGQGTPEEGSFTGTQFDTRLIKGSELFVALKGETGKHGHDFVPQALKAGAGLCLVEDLALLKGPDAKKLVAVPDSLAAFQTLANYWRRKLNKPVLGITGSVGKTTTKELLACILSARSPGAYARRSFNNHIGVPFSICDAGPEDNWITLELGMNHPGELDVLSRVAEPDVALITRVAPVHMFAFKSIDEVADAKCEILNGLKKSGTAVLNRDDEVLMAGARRSKSLPQNVLYFGTHAESDAQVTEVTGKGFAGIAFTLRYAGKTEEYELPVLGRHNAHNAAAAILAARAGFPDLTHADMAQALKNFTPPPMRLNQRRLKNGALLIDDSYNSSPEALKAFLAIAADVRETHSKLGILVGDMLELGAAAESHHAEAGERIAALKPSFVAAVGEFAPLLTRAAEKTGIAAFSARTPEEAAKLITARPFDLLFVKGSRGVGLDRAVKSLIDHFGERTG